MNSFYDANAEVFAKFENNLKGKEIKNNLFVRAPRI